MVCAVGVAEEQRDKVVAGEQDNRFFLIRANSIFSVQHTSSVFMRRRSNKYKSYDHEVNCNG